MDNTIDIFVAVELVREAGILVSNINEQARFQLMPPSDLTCKKYWIELQSELRILSDISEQSIISINELIK